MKKVNTSKDDIAKKSGRRQSEAKENTFGMITFRDF
jgi:hypothetical protein